MNELEDVCIKYFETYKDLLEETHTKVYLNFCNVDNDKRSKIYKTDEYYLIELNLHHVDSNFAMIIDSNIRQIVLDNFKLETPRLYIRRYSEKDIDDVYEIASNPNIALTDGYKPETSFEEFQKTYYKYYIKNATMFAVVLKETNKVIGGISLRPNSTRVLPCYEIGYNIHEDYWRKGYAYEASYASIKYLFDNLHIEMMTCAHFHNNEASKGLINKLGFTYEGVLRNSFYHTAFGNMDLVTYSLMKDEFK
ncbi:MAG: GNAT family N-acetyltransferase [Erysipelotrichales bacterium]|nr:GNAT family N-acetyltransferase [Erysipelotrichales bacterium]